MKVSHIWNCVFAFSLSELIYFICHTLRSCGVHCGLCEKSSFKDFYNRIKVSEIWNCLILHNETNVNVVFRKATVLFPKTLLFYRLFVVFDLVHTFTWELSYSFVICALFILKNHSVKMCSLTALCHLHYLPHVKLHSNIYIWLKKKTIMGSCAPMFHFYTINLRKMNILVTY